MSIEMDVGKVTYESWPLGAVRKIEMLESRIKEICDFMNGQVLESFNLIEKYKPNDEVLQTNGEERKIWNDVKCAKTAIENRTKDIYPKPRTI